MSWRTTFSAHFGPGTLCGLTFGDWLNLLIENRFDINWRYLPRAGFITASSLQNSFYRFWERWLYDAAIRKTKPQPPLFILGIWRSGTTHLHNLLARDPRLAAPTTYEMLYSHTFLTTTWFNAPLIDSIIPQTRAQDNVKMSTREPQEDEFALNCQTQLSPLLGMAFPRRMAHYNRFITFRDCSAGEIERWKAALYWLTQKLTYKHGRRLVLKSPCHTARIRLLLELFPDAQFVHIHRHPYDVFRSTRHLMQTAMPWSTLQRIEPTSWDDNSLQQYAAVFDAYFAERDLIPSGRLHEIRYEHLETDPLGELRKLYASLNLGEFNSIEPALRAYLATISKYEKNRHPELEPHGKSALHDRCPRCFHEWDYPA